LPFVINEATKKNDDGFIQRGFARLLTNDKTDTSIICAANTAADSNEYIRPPLNTDNLPNVDGDTVTVPTSSGDINIEYQYCLYYDSYNEFDPNSDPNKIMDWAIEKVEKVIPMPHIDTSGFSWGDYYVMQWKVVVPHNCKTINSFTIWQPNNVGIFMNKYAENNGIAYYVSNPLLPTRYQEMAGTYIGTDAIYSLLPQNPLNEDEITIYYDTYYHPYDITQNGIINLEEFALLADDYLSSDEHDLTGDGMVDLEDISLLLNYYLDDTRWESFLIVYPSGDFNHDNKVNMIDFARLADLWLNGSPNETNLENLTALCENWLYGTNQ